MTSKEWKKRYIKRLMKNGLDREEAEENYMSEYYEYKDHFFNDIGPEEAADDEISYYINESIYK